MATSLTIVDALLALPGVGPYTARAVRVFAFERDEAVVETNIARLLARVAGERLTAKRVQAIADALVPAGEGWAWNQVLMDLGATVCRPVPRCGELPDRRLVRVALQRALRSRPRRRLCGSQHHPGALRRQRSTGPRPGPPRPRQRRRRRLIEFPPAIVAGLVADRLVVRAGVSHPPALR